MYFDCYSLDVGFWLDLSDVMTVNIAGSSGSAGGWIIQPHTPPDTAKTRVKQGEQTARIDVGKCSCGDMLLFSCSLYTIADFRRACY